MAESKLNAGARETLAALRQRGIPIGILTRNRKDNAWAVADKHGLHFDAVVGREDGPVKPDTFGVLHLCRRFGVEPAQTLLVGDYLFDLLCARAAGAIPVLLANHDRAEEFARHADFTVASLTELLPIDRPSQSRKRIPQPDTGELMYRLVIIAALGSAWRPACPGARQAPAAGPAPQTASDPNALDQVLKNLQDKAAELKSYQVNMDYLFKQPLLESQQRRTGVLYYAKFDKRSDLRIDFRTLQQDEEKEQTYEQQYLFDGVWLLEVDHQLKTATHRQLAEPNKPLDALSLASKQVPVLGFSQVEDLRKQFEIELVAEPLARPRPGSTCI